MSGQTHRKPRKTRSQSLKEKEFTLYGWNACRIVFEKRPKDIHRVFFSRERSSQLAAVKKWCQSHKLPYRKLDSESLNKVAASVHHEGVVMVVRPLKSESVHTLIRSGLPPGGLVVALDRVENPHNAGAILRSCAYFGVSGLFMEADEGKVVMSSSAVRMAEGAFETVPIYRSTDLPSALRDFRSRKVFVLGADIQASRSLYDTDVPFPCVLVLGNEREGLSDRVRKRCDKVVHVPGSGDMESLNVSVSAAVILAELSRRKIGSA